MTKFGFSCFGSRWRCVFPLHSGLFSFEEWQGAPMPHGQSLSDKELVSFSNTASEISTSSLKTLVYLPFRQKSWYPANMYMHFAIIQFFMDLSCAVPMAIPKLRINLELRFVGFPKLVNPLVPVHNRLRCGGDRWDYHHERPSDHFDKLHCH